jgi:hypothetical protein
LSDAQLECVITRLARMHPRESALLLSLAELLP